MKPSHRPLAAGRRVALVALCAAALLPAGCSSGDHPTAPDKPVVMKAGARGGHRGAAGAVPAPPPGQ